MGYQPEVVLREGRPVGPESDEVGDGFEDVRGREPCRNGRVPGSEEVEDVGGKVEDVRETVDHPSPTIPTVEPIPRVVPVPSRPLGSQLPSRLPSDTLGVDGEGSERGTDAGRKERTTKGTDTPRDSGTR